MLSDIDIDRCVRACFAWCDTMTPEQRDLAEALIHDGPPNNPGHVVLKWPPGATWDSALNTITTLDGTVVQLRQPAMWHGGEAAAARLAVEYP